MAMLDPSQVYCISSVGQGSFLAASGAAVQLRSGREEDATGPRICLRTLLPYLCKRRLRSCGNTAVELLAGRAPELEAGIGWRLLPCPHQPGAVYVVHDRQQSFLDTHGEDLHAWNSNGRDIQTIIAGNTSRHAGNIRWRLLDCPHQMGAFYIVNERHGKFLDSNGGSLSLWNNGGKDVEEVIAGNTSRWAANIRWRVLPMDHEEDGSSSGATIALVPQPRPPPREVRIAHFSDTHNLHRSIESDFGLPEADVMLHTGDFSDQGSDAEISDFDAWLGEVCRKRYAHIVVIPGNHDWWSTLREVEAGRLRPEAAVQRQYMQSKLRNARVLCHEEVELFGLRIFGSSWSPWQMDASPDSLGRSPARQATLEAWQEAGGKADVFSSLPKNVDVLMTHGPADRILDCLGEPGQSWGSSKKLRKAIRKAKPRMHLFGHLHEQRGEYRRGPAGYEGGVEYSWQGEPFPTTGPPPADYPCELISCNAMCNHPGIEGTGKNVIAGPARLIRIAPCCSL